MAINDINTPWEGHSGSEVEGFIKESFGMKFGYAEYSAGKIIFYEDSTKENILNELVLSGDIYAIAMSMNVGAAISLLTGESSKIITFTPTTTVSHSIGGESEAFPEGYTYSVAYDTGTGFVVRDSGAIAIGETGSVDIRPRVVIGTNRIRITVTGATSNYTRSTIITCTMTNLRFDVAHNWLNPWYEGQDYTINGIRLDGALTKTLHVKVDNTEVEVEGQIPKTFSASANYWQASTTLTIPKEYFPIDTTDDNAMSGQHVVELWLTGTGIETEHIAYNILCVMEGEENPLVCVNYIAENGVNFSANTLFKYFTLNATKVYIEPTVTAEGQTFVLDTQVIANLEDCTEYTFNTRLEVDTEATTGTVALEVTPEGTEGIYMDGVVEITMPLDNSLQYIAIKEPAPTLYWTASSRSNGELDRGSIINTATNPVTKYAGSNWSGMTWSTDGWTTDTDGNKALCMPAGCSVSFPNLKPFTLGNTIEFMFRSSVIADMNTPVMSFTQTAAGSDGNVTIGCIVYPMKIVVLGTLEQNNLAQEIGLCEDVITHVTITKIDNYLESNKSLLTVYINGIPNVSFSFNSGQSSFGEGALTLGQNSTDFYLYMMRCYSDALADSAVLVNYLNAVFDTVVDRAAVRTSNAIVDAGIQYSMCRNKYNCFIIEPENEELEIPSFYNQVTVQCNVYFEYAEHHDWDVMIKHVPVDGQGTTSKKYFRWNLRGKFAKRKEENGVVTPASAWYYSNGNGTTIGTYPDPNEVSPDITGNKGYMDGGAPSNANHPHLQIQRFTAKKNVASSPQGHKMGATDLYDELFTRLGLKNELPSNKVRVAVWQYPFLGFRKRGANYEYIGLYTIGPDKGCKTTFGYKGDDESADGGYDYSACMCIEGPNHNPRGTRFLHPWVDVWYDSGAETLKFGIGDAEHAQEGWDDDFSADIDSDTDNPAEIQQILDMYVSEWKPAYDLVYHCSPYIASLQEAKAQHYSILELSQSGSYTDEQIVAAMNSHLSGFFSAAVRTNGEKNELLSFYDSNYDIWYYSNTHLQYVKLTAEDNDATNYNIVYYLRHNNPTTDYLTLTEAVDAVHPTTSEIITARVKKFKAEMGNYFSINQTLFHKCFCLLIGAKDNDAKNTYPFKHLKLTDPSGKGRWGWKQDDLDSIFSIDNNGMSTMKYSIEQGDTSGNVEIFQGSDSAFWTLIWRYYQTGTQSEPSLRDMMSRMMDKMQEIAEEKHLNTATDNYLHDYVYKTLKYYFFDHSALYFPIVAYQDDRTYAYLDPWRMAGTLRPNGEQYQSKYNDVEPLTQALGDRYQDERLWLERRIAYIFSKYRIGAFTGSNAGWGEMAFSLKNNFTFNLVPAIDLYPVTNKGGGADSQASRTTAGNNAQIYMMGDASGTGYYIKAVDWLKSLGNLSGMLLGSRTGVDESTISFSISAKRLENLQIGDETSSNVVFNANELNVTSAPALKVINAKNVTTLNSIVDLRACHRLREAYFDGTNAIGLLLPVGSRLTNVTFPENLQTLFLHTLNQLTASNMVISQTALPRIQTFYYYKCAQLNPLTILHTLLSTSGTALSNVYMNWDGIINITDEQWDDLLELASDVDEAPKYKNATYSSGTAGVSKDNFNRATVIGRISAGIVLKEELDIIEAAFPNLIITTERVLDYVTFNDRHFWEECCFYWGDVEQVTGKIAQGQIIGDGSAYVYSDFVFACCHAMPTRRLASGTTLPAVAAAAQDFDIEITAYNLTPFSSFAGSDEVIQIYQHTMNSTTEPTKKGYVTLSNWQSGSSGGKMTIRVNVDATCKYIRVAIMGNNNAVFDWVVKAVTGSYQPLGITTSQMAVPTTLSSYFAYTRVLKDLRELRHFIHISSIGTNEFYDARSIERIVVPPNVTVIPQRTFKQCYALYDITLPSGLTAINSTEAFQYTSALEHISFPSTLLTIGNNAFYGSGLQEAILKEGITSFGSATFYSCTNLKLVSLPSSTTTIYGDFCRGDANLETIIVRKVTPPTLSGSNHFTNCSKLSKIIVPSDSIFSYSAANLWAAVSGKLRPMISGNSFNLANGTYLYYLEPELNAQNVTWSIESNNYLTLAQQPDGSVLLTASGITNSVDTNVDLQCTFTSYGIVITDTLTLSIKHVEYMQFEDEMVNKYISYAFGDAVLDTQGGIVAQGSFSCDGTLQSTNPIFANNTAIAAKTRTDGISSGAISAYTCDYDIEIDFGTRFPFEAISAGTVVIAIAQNNTTILSVAIENIEISEEGKYNATFTTTTDCKWLQIKVAADSGVTASWTLTRKKGSAIFEPIGVTMAQIQAVTSIGTVFSYLRASNFKEFKYFTGVTSLPNSAFANCNFGTFIIPVNVTDGAGSGLYTSFYNSASINKIIISEGANLGNGNRSHYQGDIEIWVLGESCTQVWDICHAQYAGRPCIRKIIINTQTVKPIQKQNYFSKTTQYYWVYVPANMVDAYKADSTWQTNFNTDWIYPIDDYDGVIYEDVYDPDSSSSD